MEHSDSSFANYADLKLKSTHFSISFIKIGFWQLDHPPDFEIEKVSQSRKREKPEPVPDFTQEQASCCRRHWIEVPEEDFDKHYEKILVCCPRLKSIREDHFPFRTLSFSNGLHH
ncbi:hypothetical protein QJS10_CPA05g00239 [Acorus calamus]|uniref:TRF2/HOY1 PH-like domain-containing protein n=1 Tax=Acorus calamus TaxID=4465 RepID=A0AAV9EYF7_ACOCL|nr:hypothetical protein QJS10_CPA05g00239 [Acorus calamus]